MRTMNGRLKKRTPQKLQTRIIIYFTAVLLLILLLIVLPWGIYIQKSVQEDNRKLVTQQLEGADGILSSNIEKWNNIIDILMLNRQFESQVRDPNKFNRQIAINNTLTRILINDLDLISVVYIDNEQNYYLMSNSWHLYHVYPAMLAKDLAQVHQDFSKCEMTYFYNGGDVVEMTKDKEPFVSFVRPVYSIADFQQIGTIIFNITSSRLGEIIGNQMGQNAQVYLYSENGTVIARTPNAKEESTDLPNYILSRKEFNLVHTKDQSKILCKKKSALSDLYLLSVTPVEGSLNFKNTSVLVIPVILLTCVLIYMSQIYITKRVGKPLADMCAHMRLAEEGKFVPIKTRKKKSRDEITQLQLFFNRMIEAIDALMDDIVEKEKMKRKHEVALLQEQIKPHFLYNALDAVSALLLIEDTEKAYTLTQSLSSFYRTSLSGGYEIVSLQSELECIRNYMTVLNIRFDNKIAVHYEIEEGLRQESVLKLVLQPLVENAVYHGIRPRDGMGSIWITAKRQEPGMVLSVKDDGVGMSQERIQEVLSKQSHEKQNGFGLYSLIEKINLFYNEKGLLKIESQPGAGTAIYLYLPLLNLPDRKKGEGNTH